MNQEAFQKLLVEYKANYEVVNDPEGRHEIYKWIAVHTCLKNWNLDADNFMEMFKASMKDTFSLLDNDRKHPNSGITFLCNNGKTEEVRKAFRILLEEEEDVKKMQSKAEDFRDEITSLLSEMAPKKWSLIPELRDVLTWLSLIQPENHFLYKSTPAQKFIKKMDVGDNIGSGQNFHLDAYYRMCNDILEEVKKDKELFSMLDQELIKNAERINLNPEELLQIPGKLNLLVYDIMYVANALNLYSSLPEPNIRKKSGKKKESEDHLSHYEELKAKLEEEEKNLSKLRLELFSYPDFVGLEVSSLQFGKGKVIAQNNPYITVAFAKCTKEFMFPGCATKGFLKGFSSDDISHFESLARQNEEIDKIKNQMESLKYELSLLHKLLYEN